MANLPASESRRAYHKKLVTGMKLVCKVDAAQASEAIDIVISYLQKKVAAGEDVDLGFMCLKGATVKPATHTTRFKGEGSAVYLTGQTLRYKVGIRKSWLKKVKPSWSRHQ